MAGLQAPQRIAHPSHPGHALELVANLSDGNGRTYRCQPCNYNLYICTPGAQGMQLQNVPVGRRSKLKRAWKFTKLLGRGTLCLLTLDPTHIPGMAEDVVALFKK